METSALSGENLEESFNVLITEVYKKCKNEFVKNDYLNLGDAVEEIQTKKDKSENTKNAANYIFYFLKYF